ncbi:MAG: hypothetical protein V4616_07630 [Bacteroidota bacterium]
MKIKHPHFLFILLAVVVAIYCYTEVISEQFTKQVPDHPDLFTGGLANECISPFKRPGAELEKPRRLDDIICPVSLRQSTTAFQNINRHLVEK